MDYMRKAIEALDMLTELAREDPITEVADEMNGCKYCGSTWCESTYDEYLKNTANGTLVQFSSHYPDCLWVKANTIVRSVNT